MQLCPIMSNHKIRQNQPSTIKEPISNPLQAKDVHPMQNLSELLERSITSSLAIFDRALLGIDANPDISNEMATNHKEKISVILECYRALAQSNNRDELSSIPDVVRKVQALVKSDKSLMYNSSSENGILPEDQSASANVPACIPEPDISFECLEICEQPDNLNGSPEMCKTSSCDRPFDMESKTIEKTSTLLDPSDSKDCPGTVTVDFCVDDNKKDASSTTPCALETSYMLDAERLLEGSDLESPRFLYAVAEGGSEWRKTSPPRITTQACEEPADRDGHDEKNAKRLTGNCQVSKLHDNGKEAALIIDLTMEIQDRVEQDARKENGSKDACISLIEIAPIKVENETSMESTDFKVPGVLHLKDSSSIVIEPQQTPEADKSLECRNSLLHEPVPHTTGTNVFNSLLSIWRYGTDWSIFRPIGSSSSKTQPSCIPDSAPDDTSTGKPDSISPLVMESHATTALGYCPEYSKGSGQDTTSTYQEKTIIVSQTTLTEMDPSGLFIETNGPVERNAVSRPDLLYSEEVDNKRADRFAGSKSISLPDKPYPSTDPIPEVLPPMRVSSESESPAAVHTSIMKVTENGLNCEDEERSILPVANKEEPATGPPGESCCGKSKTYHNTILDRAHVDVEEFQHDLQDLIIVAVKKPLESKKMSLDDAEETLLDLSLFKENVPRANVANDGTNSSVDMLDDAKPVLHVPDETKKTITSKRNLSLECTGAIDHNMEDTCRESRIGHHITRQIEDSSVSVPCSEYSDLIDNENNLRSYAIDQCPEINPSVRDIQSSIDSSKASVQSNDSSAHEILDTASKVIGDAVEQEEECFVQSPEENVHTAPQNIEDAPDINPTVRHLVSTMGTRETKNCSEFVNEILNETPAMIKESHSMPTSMMHQTDVDEPDKPHQSSRPVDVAIDETIDLVTDGIKEDLDVIQPPYVMHKSHDTNNLLANTATGISETAPNQIISLPVDGAKIMPSSENYALCVKTTDDVPTPAAESIQGAENSPSLVLESMYKPCEAREVTPSSILGTTFVALIDNVQKRKPSDTMECNSDSCPQRQDTAAVTSQSKTPVDDSTERKLAKMNGNVLKSIGCYMSTAFRSLFRVTSKVKSEKVLDERVEEQVNGTPRQALSEESVPTALPGQDLPSPSAKKLSTIVTTSEPICIDELGDEAMEVDEFFLAPQQIDESEKESFEKAMEFDPEQNDQEQSDSDASSTPTANKPICSNESGSEVTDVSGDHFPLYNLQLIEWSGNWKPSHSIFRLSDASMYDKPKVSRKRLVPAMDPFPNTRAKRTRSTGRLRNRNEYAAKDEKQSTSTKPKRKRGRRRH